MKKEIKLFDIHSHLHSSFFSKRARAGEVIEEMKEKNIYSIIVGVNFLDSQKALKMALENENLFCSIGVHPADEKKEDWKEEKFKKLIAEDRKKKIVAVGECGLDYYWPSNDLGEGKINQEEFEKEKERQKILFEKQIDFAVENNLALMLHIRSFSNADAHWDAFKILDQKQKEHKNKIRANFHFFTEGSEIVREILKRDFMISLPGVITFANLDDTIKEIPLKNLMVESDAPFATPSPHRGKVNTPIYTIEVVKKISEIKKVPEYEVRKETVKNAFNFFKIKH